MRLLRFVRLLMLGFACALGVTPAAAQTTTAIAAPAQTAGSIVPVPAPAPAKPVASLSKSVEFATVTEATAHCPDGQVVWSSLNKSHSFHISGSRYYGKTKHGAYVCKSDALAAGFHQAKS